MVEKQLDDESVIVYLRSHNAVRLSRRVGCRLVGDRRYGCICHSIAPFVLDYGRKKRLLLIGNLLLLWAGILFYTAVCKAASPACAFFRALYSLAFSREYSRSFSMFFALYSL